MPENFTFTLGVETVGLLVAPAVIAYLLYAMERRRDARERAVQLLLHFDSDEMQDKRLTAWRYLILKGEKVPPLEAHYGVDVTDEMLAVKDGLWSVLTFFKLLHVLQLQKAIDKGIVSAMIGEGVSEWAVAFTSLRKNSSQNGHLFEWMPSVRPSAASN